jgi:hypothetical protein
VPKRIKGWKNQCKYNIGELLQQVSGERQVVEHAYRVEKLVHTELKEFRLKEEECKGCGEQHNEWFNISAEHAAKVIKKYSDWTATSPYQFDDKSNKWRLSNHIDKKKVEDLCEPIALQQTDTRAGSAKKKPRPKPVPSRTRKLTLRRPLFVHP